MTNTPQTEAQRLADLLEDNESNANITSCDQEREIAAELRRLDAENQQLKTSLALVQQHHATAWNRGHEAGLRASAATVKQAAEAIKRDAWGNSQLTDALLAAEAERDQLRAQVERLRATEPFGYFRAEPFGWTDCAATDEGAIALYERPAAPAVPDTHISVQEAWEAAGGNPGIKASKADLIIALKTLDTVCDEADAAPAVPQGEPVYQLARATGPVADAWIDVAKDVYDDAGFHPSDFKRRILYDILGSPAPAVPQEPIKDHVIREAVNQLRDCAIKFHATQQLRERIAGIIVPLLKSTPAAPSQPVTLTWHEVCDCINKTNRESQYEKWQFGWSKDLAANIIAALHEKEGNG